MTVPAPYPADTRAKGWRFELDHERIRQSDTWAITPAEVRPWLLMLWMTAWEQTPCASLPDDETLIAARIGMAPKVFAKCRDKLMRGWVKADDGRLYHPVLTQRVGEMLERRRKDALRKGNQRGLPQESAKSPAPVPRDMAVTDGTGTGTGTINQKKKSAAAPPPSGVSDAVWQDFLKTRKAKVTDTAIGLIAKEAGKAGITLEQALSECCARGWRGFKADWLTTGRASPTSTVPGRVGPDPALEKIKADAKLATAMPKAERERWEKMKKAHA